MNTPYGHYRKANKGDIRCKDCKFYYDDGKCRREIRMIAPTVKRRWTCDHARKGK